MERDPDNEPQCDCRAKLIAEIKQKVLKIEQESKGVNVMLDVIQLLKDLE